VMAWLSAQLQPLGARPTHAKATRRIGLATRSGWVTRTGTIVRALGRLLVPAYSDVSLHQNPMPSDLSMPSISPALHLRPPPSPLRLQLAVRSSATNLSPRPCASCKTTFSSARTTPSCARRSLLARWEARGARAWLAGGE
jgi:hypothetical protein